MPHCSFVSFSGCAFAFVRSSFDGIFLSHIFRTSFQSPWGFSWDLLEIIIGKGYGSFRHWELIVETTFSDCTLSGQSAAICSWLKGPGLRGRRCSSLVKLVSCSRSTIRTSNFWLVGIDVVARHSRSRDASLLVAHWAYKTTDDHVELPIEAGHRIRAPREWGLRALCIPTLAKWQYVISWWWLWRRLNFFKVSPRRTLQYGDELCLCCLTALPFTLEMYSRWPLSRASSSLLFF